jgi:hypothetical protein
MWGRLTGKSKNGERGDEAVREIMEFRWCLAVTNRQRLELKKVERKYTKKWWKRRMGSEISAGSGPVLGRAPAVVRSGVLGLATWRVDHFIRPTAATHQFILSSICKREEFKPTPTPQPQFRGQERANYHYPTKRSTPRYAPFRPPSPLLFRGFFLWFVRSKLRSCLPPQC